MAILKCLSIVLSHLDVEDKKIAQSSWIDVLQVLMLGWLSEFVLLRFGRLVVDFGGMDGTGILHVIPT
jgi:hypothetical protein